MKIEVKGVIVDNDDKCIYDWFGIDATSPRMVSEQIAKAKNNEELEVEINSPGGSVFAGSEIYTTLKSYKGKVTTKIVGLAASAASVVAMAGDTVLISPTGQMMIHNASGRFSGDYRDMDKGSDILRSVNSTISNAYMIKTGLKQEELLTLMDEETWMTPQQALEKGFVDEIMFTNGVKFAASFSNGMLPPEVIKKMRNELKSKLDEQKNEEQQEEQQPEDEQLNNSLELAKAKLKLHLSM